MGPQGTSLESHYCLSLLCLLLLLEGKSWNRIGSFAPQNSDSSSPLGRSQSLLYFVSHCHVKLAQLGEAAVHNVHFVDFDAPYPNSPRVCYRAIYVALEI